MPWSSPLGEVRLKKRERGDKIMKEQTGMHKTFCIWGSQCALCPWVGSGTLLHLSPRPAVNLKWRRAEKQRLEGEWHIAVSPSCSGYLYSHCPTMTLHPFPSASLIRILHQPPIVYLLSLEDAAGGVVSEGQEVSQKSIQSTHGRSDGDWLALKVHESHVRFGPTLTNASLSVLCSVWHLFSRLQFVCIICPL